MIRIESLNGKRVTSATKTDTQVKLMFDDGSIFIATARSGPGHGEWMQYTEVTLQTSEGSVTLINE